MTRRPALTTARAAEIWSEMLWIRRELYKDSDFFKMPAVWEDLCCESKSWRINTFRRLKGKNVTPKHPLR